MNKLSIIIPVYNEEKTLKKIVDKVEKVKIPKIKKELIIINDASKDNSEKIINKLKKKYKNIKYFSHEKNQGKGAAIRIGLKHFNGDIFVIQDGDLEYNPQEFKRLIKPIIKGQTKVVYGSRFKEKKIEYHKYPLYYFGNKFLTLLTSILYLRKITDMETCYKMIHKDVIDKILDKYGLNAKKFDFEPEITAKIIKSGYKIKEIPVSYKSRSFKEGKKINSRDGLIAIYTLIKYRFFN